MSMKIGIIICDRYHSCGGGKCFRAFHRREGAFDIYREDDNAEIVGFANCGDCPGATIVTRLAQVNLWNKPMEEKVTKIHIGPCITDHCPFKDVIINKIKAKSGVEVIEGTHPYKPDNIFA